MKAGLPEPEFEEIGSGFRVTFRPNAKARPRLDPVDQGASCQRDVPLVPCLLLVTPWAKPPMTAAVWSNANGGFITQTFKDESAAVGLRPTGP